MTVTSLDGNAPEPDPPPVICEHPARAPVATVAADPFSSVRLVVLPVVEPDTDVLSDG
jgi:hypothetical protein